MECAVRGLNLSTVSPDVFVALPDLDPNARLPLDEKLLIGCLYSGGRAVLQLVYCPPPGRRDDGDPVNGGGDGARGYVGKHAGALRWLSSGNAEKSDLVDVSAVHWLNELRFDDQIKDLLKTPACKNALAQLRKMKSSASTSLWARLRHGCARERLTAVAGIVGKGLVGAFLAYVLVVLFARTAELDARIHNLRLAAVGAVAPTAESAPGAMSNQLDPSQMLVLLEAVRASGVSRFDQGDPFVMFSDPNCPACRAFEGQMAKEGWAFNPLIVPVSFQTGSQDAVAGVLCAADVAKAWQQAVEGKPAPACDKGRLQAALNNEAFSALGLDSTPTFVSMTGQVFRGASDLNTLLSWARANSPDGQIGKR